MDVKDLLSRAWSAVEEAGIPEPLHAVALKEAIDYLRSEDGESAPKRERKPDTRKQKTKEAGASTEDPDEDTFFADLASESGETEQDLRDVLRLTNDGKVQVIPPGRELGDNGAEQARNTVALVAGARGRGLQESPVNAEAVRHELKRKHCWDSTNFASKHLGSLKGFNAGSNRTEIVLGSKWVSEFRAAVAKVHGRTADTDD